MGNCGGCNKASMVWANDDVDNWESREESKEFPSNTEKQRTLGETSSASSSSSSSSEPCGGTREVKIKITKKQLRELLGNVDQDHQVHSTVPVEQVLSSLVDRSTRDRFEIQHDQRSWRPSLQSIPEFDQ